ncbi:M16 family metallopeptidase [Flavobacterium frigidarium]|jgi:zinc protease|uniref:Pitrilysin family protein n=1 Tax=Flavobacterium frigidarium TaxID=99286 RepID=A0ABV4KHX5_9FLAO|nr:pitrilysin family protein [Flavobacterium sp.]
MKKSIMILSTALMLGGVADAQNINFEEYDLNNGMHVILHHDPSAPVVVTSVMYHVGSKDEEPTKTGFAHFFEHLLFEGTANIKRGEWFKIVASNGGKNNANTSDDRTYYYEIFPSNNLELALWMESERLLHPVINQIGVDTQRGVIKEEKASRYDNRAYGKIINEVKKNLFIKHPYQWSTIGSTEQLETATLEDFRAFNKKFYIPNNAVLVVAGDFEKENAKKWIEKYFGEIQKGEKVEKQIFIETPITETIRATYQDPNIQIPMVIASYRTPSMKTRDARVLNLISAYLSDGKSSKLYKKIVDDKKIALQIGAVGFSQEDYGMYIVYGLPMGTHTSEDLLAEIDEEIVKIQTDLISERDFEKLQNQFENQYIDINSSVEGIAENLAKYYLLYGDINLINTEIATYQSISREEIRAVAKKYLNPNQRLILDYIPAKDNTKK